MSKYKVGDVLVWTHTQSLGRTIVLTEDFHNGFKYRFLDGVTADSNNSIYIFEDYCEFEYIYNSPLYRELA